MKILSSALLGQIRSEIEMSPVGICRYLELEKGDYNTPTAMVTEAIEDILAMPTKRYPVVRPELEESHLDIEVLVDISLREIFNALFDTGMKVDSGEPRVPNVIIADRLGRRLQAAQFIAEAVEDNGTDLASLESIILSKTCKDGYIAVSDIPDTGSFNFSKGVMSEEDWEARTGYWATDQSRKLALFMVSTVVETLEEFEYKNERNDGKEVGYLCCNSAKYLQDHCSRYRDFSMKTEPMTVPPKDWTKAYQGGFYTTSLNFHYNFIKRKNALQSHAMMGDTLDIEHAVGVNKAQQTAYRVNLNVHNTMLALLESGEKVDFLEFTQDTPPELLEKIECSQEYLEEDAKTELTEEELSAYNAARSEHYSNVKEQKTELDRFRSKCLSKQSTIDVAVKYAEESALWFVTNCDYRGRYYTHTTTLSPLGSDLDRGYLEFAEGHRLGSQEAINYVAHSVANNFGKDKLTIQDRVMWTYFNTQMLSDIANDPVGNLDMWQFEDDPTQALVSAFEWTAIMENGVDHVSHFINYRDQSCSGLGVFSALLRDATGGGAVNLTDNSTMRDVYTEVLTIAMSDSRLDEALEKLNGRDIDDRQLGAEALQIVREKCPRVFKERKLAKRPVMTMVYASRFITCLEEIYDVLRSDKYRINSILDRKQFNVFSKLLAHAVWMSIGDVVIGAKTGMDWMIDSVKTVATSRTKNLPVLVKMEEGKPYKVLSGDKKRQNFCTKVTWTTPTGLVVHQSYDQVHTDVLVQRSRSGKAKSIYFKSAVSGLVDVNKMANGINANYVHSLDSSLLTRIVNSYSGELSVIHDSFGCHAHLGAELDKVQREQFVKLFEQDLLGKLRQELQDQIGDGSILDAPPFIGDLDLNQVLNSHFIYS